MGENPAGGLLSSKSFAKLPDYLAPRGSQGQRGTFFPYLTKERSMKLNWLAAILATAIALPTAARAADETKSAQTPTASAPSTSETPAAKPLKGRLPAFYGKLSIDTTQKQKIYEIEASFGPKIKALREQLESLEADENDQMRAILTPDQQEKLKALIAEARSKRHGATSETKAKPASSEKASSSSSSTTETTPTATTTPSTPK
jgi:Spy/CpxP family protein refolding chaperone